MRISLFSCPALFAFAALLPAQAQTTAMTVETAIVTAAGNPGDPLYRGASARASVPHAGRGVGGSGEIL